jgi:putative aldouronate transport system substrate-binding protein
MKKIFALSLILALLVGALPSVALATEAPTITWLLSQDNNVPENTEIQQELNKRLGINLQITNVNRSDYNTKLNTLIAADTLPDIFHTNGQTAIDLRDAGKLADWAPYLAQYGADIRSEFAEGELEALDVNNGQDGRIYGINHHAGMYISNFHIRKDWLKNVGMEVPTTVDELYEMFKAFRFNDPDKNGKDDTWGFTAQVDTPKTWEHIFAIYGIPFDQNIQLENGTVTRYIKHPNYIRAITFLQRLYQENIMDPDFATMTWVAYAESLWNGKIGIFDFQSVGPANNWFPGRYTFELPETVDELFTFANVANVDTGAPSGGVKPYASQNSYAAVIASSCTNVEKAIELINYIYFTEEGQDLTYLGIEGTMYRWIDKANGEYERLGNYKDDLYHRSAGAFVYNGYGGWTTENAETRTMNALTQESQRSELKIATDYAFIGATLKSWSEYGTSLKSVEMQMLTNLITSSNDVEDEYQQFLEQWDEEGGKEFEEEATAYLSSI